MKDQGIIQTISPGTPPQAWYSVRATISCGKKRTFEINIYGAIYSDYASRPFKEMAVLFLYG